MNKSSSASSTAQVETSTKPTTQKEIFYSPACDELIAARQVLSTISFQQARNRLLRTKALLNDDALLLEDNQRVYDLYTHTGEMTLHLSQFGDDRPLTTIAYSSDQSLLLTGSLNHTVKLWDSTTLAERGTLRGHTERITCVAQSTYLCNNEHKMIFASAAADGTCVLWNLQPMLDDHHSREGIDSMDMDVDSANPSRSLSYSPSDLLMHRLGPIGAIVAACSFHPHSPLVATACHDFSWRLWDVHTGQQLLLQDGHVRECCVLALHPDGSLLYSADSGGVGLLWDLRSGQMVQSFLGHSKKITAADFNPNGFQLATSGVDHTVKLWDLRKRKNAYTLPAHPDIVSSVRYSTSGELLLTSSFDGTIKIWSARDYRILRTMSGHAGKVMAADFALDEHHVASVGYDRTIKLWAHKDEF